MSVRQVKRERGPKAVTLTQLATLATVKEVESLKPGVLEMGPVPTVRILSTQVPAVGMSHPPAAVTSKVAAGSSDEMTTPHACSALVVVSTTKLEERRQAKVTPLTTRRSRSGTRRLTE